MIDPTLRLEHLARAAADARHRACSCSTWCSVTAPSPTRRPLLAPAIAEVGQPVVVAVVGTAADPQDLDRQVRPSPTPAPRCTCPTPRATRRAVELIGGAPMTTPHTSSASGADLLADAVAAQAVAGHPRRLATADGRAPRPTSPTVAADPLRRDANERALAAMLERHGHARRRRAGLRGARACEPGEFLHAGPPIDVGPGRRAAARCADGRRRAGGTGRRSRGRRRALRVRRRGLARAVPPPRHGRADGRRGHPRMWMFVLEDPAPGGVLTARSTRASARCCGTAPTGPTCSPGCAG